MGGWSQNKWRGDWWQDGLTTNGGETGGRMVSQQMEVRQDGLTTNGGETGGRMVSQQMEVRLVGGWSHNKWR